MCLTQVSGFEQAMVTALSRASAQWQVASYAGQDGGLAVLGMAADILCRDLLQALLLHAGKVGWHASVLRPPARDSTLCTRQVNVERLRPRGTLRTVQWPTYLAALRSCHQRSPQPLIHLSGLTPIPTLPLL